MLIIFNSLFTLFSYLFLIQFQLIYSTQVLRPRGVPLQKKIFYDSSRDFTCLDGSLSIPFHFVNDDYCDCLDGSDEPGTAACPNAFFHCLNLGYIEKDIPSSRVNDGVCDCCDGSDEYNSTIKCEDVCEELGREALEEAKRLEHLFGAGSQIREKYIEDGKQKRHEFIVTLEELKTQIKALELVKNEKKALQDQAVELEKEALDKYKKIKDEKKKLEEEEEVKKSQLEENELAVNSFKELDIDNDGLLTYMELQQFPKFDQNEDGIVEKEEAKFFLHMKNEMDLEEFVSIGWVIIKPFYLKDKNIADLKQQIVKEDLLNETESEKLKEKLSEESKLAEEENFIQKTKVKKEWETDKKDKNIQDYENNEKEKEPEEEIEEEIEEEVEEKVEKEVEGEEEVEEKVEKEVEEGEDDEEVEENQEQEQERETFDQTSPKFLNKYTHTLPENETEYDDETKRLMEEAEKARKDYKEIESQFFNLNKKLQELEHLLNLDLGTEGEFHVLHGQCFEYTDNEYTYKFCPFVKASQRPKDTETETLLGQWGQWSGEFDKKYEKQRYLKGITCWNGPERSVNVHLKCGLNNQLLLVKEPSRCEYLFEFETPALCKKTGVSEIKEKHLHLEL